VVSNCLAMPRSLVAVRASTLFLRPRCQSYHTVCGSPNKHPRATPITHRTLQSCMNLTQLLAQLFKHLCKMHTLRLCSPIKHAPDLEVGVSALPLPLLTTTLQLLTTLLLLFTSHLLLLTAHLLLLTPPLHLLPNQLHQARPHQAHLTWCPKVSALPLLLLTIPLLLLTTPCCSSSQANSIKHDHDQA